jgi:hypothetical protein
MCIKVDNYLVKKCYDTDTNRSFFDVYVSTDNELFGEYVGEISMDDAIANNLIDEDGEIDVDKMGYYIFTQM